MFFPFIRKVPLPVCLVLFLFISVLSNSTKAQGFEDDPLFGDDEIGFEESSGDFQDDNFGVSGDFLDPAMEGEGDPFAPVDDEDDLYIDEESFGIDTEQAFQDSMFTQRELLQRERLQGIANIGYGAGTGLMIGSWSAFIAQETTTRNQWRTIGTSTVLGGVIGMLLGTRSIWDPAAARPDTGKLKVEEEWLVKHEVSGFKIAYAWKF
jgi:hypothetical protein|tara:strand:- start:3494 stop:4117 length:624 start_codon:yes stop_codon:yes gene_type:complete